jgi:hypothetical protein
MASDNDSSWLQRIAYFLAEIKNGRLVIQIAPFGRYSISERQRYCKRLLRHLDRIHSQHAMLDASAGYPVECARGTLVY